MCPISTGYGPWAHGGQGPLYPSNAENGLFRAFPAFLGFLTDSGGPSLPLGPFLPERQKHPEYATLRLLVTLSTLVPLEPDGSRGALRPYSWPPEQGSLLPWADSRRP